MPKDAKTQKGNRNARLRKRASSGSRRCASTGTRRPRAGDTRPARRGGRAEMPVSTDGDRPRRVRHTDPGALGRGGTGGPRAWSKDGDCGRQRRPVWLRHVDPACGSASSWFRLLPQKHLCPLSPTQLLIREGPRKAGWTPEGGTKAQGRGRGRLSLLRGVGPGPSLRGRGGWLCSSQSLFAVVLT